MTFTCHCGLPIRQRTQGQCRFIFPDGRQCRSKRGLQFGNVSDHLPNVWYAGWEHYDPDSACTICGLDEHDQYERTHSFHPSSVRKGHRAEEEHMASHCRLTLEALTEVLAGLQTAPPNADDLIDELSTDAAAIARAELAQLPRDFYPMLIAAHAVAVESGVPFSVIAEEPPKPVLAARTGLVSYRIEHDEAGVRMYVAHVHGHHAEWMSKPEAVTT